MGSGGSKEPPPPKNKPKQKNNQSAEESKPGGEYKPFTDFPDPLKLAKAQTDYKKANVQVEKKNGIPVPHPPPTTSKELLAKQDFKAIDDRVSAPEALQYAEDDYQTLAEYLTATAKNDVEKVRAFFMFIASQNPNKVFKHPGCRSLNQGSPLMAILTILSKNLNGLYNEILEKLCKAVQIPVMQERTDVKGKAYRVGHAVGHWGNTICLVYVDKAWRMIDQHWGSESVSVQQDDEWILVEDKGATKSMKTQEQYFYRVNEFYFLTDPVHMAFSHLCEPPEKQLLARPLTKTDFDEIAYLQTGYFEFGMGKLSHPKCIVKCDTGSVEFKFGLEKGRKFRFFHDIYKSVLDPKTDRFRGRQPKDFSKNYTNADGTELTVTIDFPWIGKYKLVLEGTEVGKYSRLAVCEYLIHVTTPNHGAEPIPYLPTGQDELGITGAIRNYGVVAIEESGTIHTKNGHARIAFTFPANAQLKFRPELLLPNTARKDNVADNKSIVRYFLHKGKLEIDTHVSSQEQRLLRITVMKNNREERMFYLIIPDRLSPRWTSNYPRALMSGGQVGDIEGDDGLTPVSHKEPLFESPANGNATIEMKQETKTDLQIKSCLMSHSYTADRPINVSEYHFHEQKGEKHYFSLRFTKVGIYSLNITSMTTKRPLYQYVITVNTPDLNAVPFPASQEGWKEGLRVNEPRQGELEEKSKVHFNIIVPGAKKVNIEGKNKTSALTKGEGGEWTGDVDIEEETPEIKISAEIEDDFTDELLTYQVLNPEQQKAKEEQRKQYAKDAERDQQNLDTQNKKSEKEAENKKKKKEDDVNKAKDDFEKNRKKYEEREKELEEEAEKKLVKEEQPDYTKINLDQEMEDKELQKKIARKKKETEEGWKDLYGEKSKKMAEERLKEAIGRRDLQGMEKGVHICKEKGVGQRLIDKANYFITLEYKKKSLQEAMDEEDIDRLKELITEISSKNKWANDLRRELMEAEILLEKLEKLEKMGYRVLDMDAKTMSELRRYGSPPPDVHNVLRASLLILGEDEETTEEWNSVRKLLTTTGKNNLNKKVMNCDPVLLNHELAARSRQLLTEIDYKKLRRQSAGAAVFYIWTMGMLDDAQVGADTQPALLDRQKSILDRKTPPPKRPSDYYRETYRKERKPSDVKPKPPREEEPKPGGEDQENKQKDDEQEQ